MRVAYFVAGFLITTVLIGATVGIIFRVKLRKLRKTFFVFE